MQPVSPLFPSTQNYKTTGIELNAKDIETDRHEKGHKTVKENMGNAIITRSSP